MHSELKNFWAQAYFIQNGLSDQFNSLPENKYYQFLIIYILRLEQLNKIQMSSNERWALLTNIINKEINKQNSIDYYRSIL